MKGVVYSMDLIQTVAGWLCYLNIWAVLQLLTLEALGFYISGYGSETMGLEIPVLKEALCQGWTNLCRTSPKAQIGWWAWRPILALETQVFRICMDVLEIYSLKVWILWKSCLWNVSNYISMKCFGLGPFLNNSIIRKIVLQLTGEWKDTRMP